MFDYAEYSMTNVTCDFQLPDQPSDSLFHQYKQGYMDTDDLPALAPDVKVFDLTRILKGEHADDSGPDSPGFLQRSKRQYHFIISHGRLY